MSHNQSRAERSESTQYRKTGRSGSSNQQRQFQGSASSKGGGGAPFNSANRSYNKKYNNNAQGGQSRVRGPNVDSDSAGHAFHNSPQEQLPSHISSISNNVKLTDAPAHKITQVVPRSPSSDVSNAAPTPNVSAANPESGQPKTPTQDAPGSFSLQFGSISLTPSAINVVQIPARTSSAPPNLDEQKKDQARQNLLRAGPVPIPIPKQPVVKKDAGVPNQTNAREAHSISKPKRDIQVSVVPPVTQIQKPGVHSMPGMPMQMPFHQTQVQFGGPNPQIQPQALSGTPLPLSMQMPLPIGNPQMQQQMFISSLQPHPLQSQAMMQGQNFNFPPQMAHQLPPQLGNMGINMTPQFPQHQAGKYGASRKTVKITHPDTHEELRLDGSPAPRSHPVVPPQSQPIPSFPQNHQMNFYPNSYNTNTVYFPTASTIPLSSTQIPPTSQPPRFHNQVTVKPPLGIHGEKEPLIATSSVSVRKAESSEPSALSGEDSVRPQKEVESSSLISVPHSKPGLGVSSTSAASSDSINVESDACNNATPALVHMDGSASILKSSANESINKVAVPVPLKDIPNEPLNLGQQDQVGKQLSSLSSPTSHSLEPEAVNTKSTLPRTNLACETSKESVSTNIATSEASDFTGENIEPDSVNSRQSEPEITVEMEGKATSQSLEFDKDSLDTSLKSLSLESPKVTGEVEESIGTKITSHTSGLLEGTEEKPEESLGCRSDDVNMAVNYVESSHTEGGQNADNPVSVDGLSAQDDKTSIADTECLDDSSKPDIEDIDNNSDSLVSTSSSVKDKVLLDASVSKTALPRGKKKKRELYRKAEAAGTISDLYMAYKGPEDKKDAVTSAESTEETSSNNKIKQISSEISKENDLSNEKPPLTKVEPDDWEDAAEISPQLESKNVNQGSDVDENGLMTKRYSRDFLLKFVEQCTDLPAGFDISSEVADALMVSNVNIRESHPSPGRNFDRASGGSRLDRRASGHGDEDKWNKFPGPLMSGRGDMRADIVYANNASFRPGQVSNYGVLRNTRPQTPNQHAGGILSGPMQSLGPQGVLLRNNSDADRWQRGTGFQKGLMPPPQTPPPIMHRAEKRYEVGKVTDEEEAKQRQLKGILNKLTPQNFEKLFQQVQQVNIDNVVTLSGVISQIFDKALMEPTFCEMYADFCFHLAAGLPELSVDNEKITFKRLLLNKCQEEFERGEREEQEANETGEGESKQTEEEREEKRLRVRRRMLGNIRLIGELYKKRMLTERIMHECIGKLLGQQTQHQNPDEENIEALCKLMSTIGVMIDHPKAKDHMDAYFLIMTQLSNNTKLSSRVRFMLRDSIDLRKNKWQQRRKVEGPKKIEDVHRDAAQERQAQTSRLGRVSSIGGSNRRGPSMDFAPRTPNMLSPPGSQISSFRPGGPQLRGHGSQDARTDERHSYENRTMSIPLPQRPLGDASITLGPQGGLVRGMAYGGQPSASSSRLAEISSPGDARRVGPGLNGFSSIPERMAYGQREDPVPRYASDRFIVPSSYDQERNVTHGNRNKDRIDESLPTSPPARDAPQTSTENTWPEEHLRGKSMITIKEFYSARDESEVAMCIKDLNAPGFYPSMISIWLVDSFERKDVERELLTKLLINLTKSQDGLLSQTQLVRGFESVLAVLEDAVNDAPRAAEFLGRFFARVVLEKVVSLSEIGRLVYEGGEEQGSLVEAGIAADVVGTILDTIKSEKGDSVLNEIRSSSNLQLQNFRPPGSNRPCRIDKFM
ncbi:eukaryotic translation initiation factor 4G-like isoform X2 [Salvia hispanica]|uniref:eukaryotic translation initiation factor 4G-like isoform X2 n=1 Tax=Salvia hispanica TaxID=49212 RepID=UPI002009A53C|nr:eukaryotic translation initiation factor 4G-like isoform X2 [Salvia hispanica]